MSKFEDKVENVHVYMDGSRVSLCCDYDGARYHVWLDTKNSLAPMRPLYKNPPIGVEYGSPEYYSTRHRSIDSQFGRRLVGVMVERMRSENLLLKAAEAESDREADERALIVAARIKARKEEAAEELYAALRTLLDSASGKGNSFEAMEVARQALAKADLGAVVKVQP